MGDREDGCWLGERSRVKRVLIVGAGVAGLQVAKALSGAGYRVVVLEQQGSVGGVWAMQGLSYRPSVTWRFYRFPDFPPHRPLDERVEVGELRNYINAYVQKFNLAPLIKLNCQLSKLTRRQRGGWKALFVEVKQSRRFTIHVDFAVICNGVYAAPNVPDYEGWNTFRGLQLHSKDFVACESMKGRDVLLVGAGQTAFDCVVDVAAGKLAASVTLLYRQAHWLLSADAKGSDAVRAKLSSRGICSFLKPYYDASTVQKVAYKLLAPVRTCFWRSWESKLEQQSKPLSTYQPTRSLRRDLLYTGRIVDSQVFRSLKGVKLQKGEIHHFYSNGVALADGTFLPADVVIYCTGYTKSYSFLDSGTYPQLNVQKDGLYLYRNILPPYVQGLAFVGAEASTYNNILTSGLQAQWLLNVLQGQVQLPPVPAMQADVQLQQSWKRKVIPSQRNRGSCIMLYQAAYHEQLLKDMGKTVQQKSRVPLLSCFAPYTAEDFQMLYENQLDHSTGRVPVHHHSSLDELMTSVVDKHETVDILTTSQFSICSGPHLHHHTSCPSSSMSPRNSLAQSRSLSQIRQASHTWAIPAGTTHSSHSTETEGSSLAMLLERGPVYAGSSHSMLDAMEQWHMGSKQVDCSTQTTVSGCPECVVRAELKGKNDKVASSVCQRRDMTQSESAAAPTPLRCSSSAQQGPPETACVARHCQPRQPPCHAARSTSELSTPAGQTTESALLSDQSSSTQDASDQISESASAVVGGDSHLQAGPQGGSSSPLTSNNEDKDL